MTASVYSIPIVAKHRPELELEIDQLPPEPGDATQETIDFFIDRFIATEPITRYLHRRELVSEDDLRPGISTTVRQAAQAGYTSVVTSTCPDRGRRVPLGAIAIVPYSRHHIPAASSPALGPLREILGGLHRTQTEIFEDESRARLAATIKIIAVDNRRWARIARSVAIPDKRESSKDGNVYGTLGIGLAFDMFWHAVHQIASAGVHRYVTMLVTNKTLHRALAAGLSPTTPLDEGIDAMTLRDRDGSPCVQRFGEQTGMPGLFGEARLLGFTISDGDAVPGIHPC